MAPKNVPLTIYGNFPVRRIKKPSLIIVFIIIFLILAVAYAVYSFIYSRQFTPLTAQVFFTEAPLGIIETAQKIDKGESVGVGKTIQIPIEAERVILLVGEGITIRPFSGARFKFVELQKNVKTNQQFVVIDLLKGTLWVTRDKGPNKVLLKHSLADVELVGDSQVETRISPVTGSLEVLCWKGEAKIYPAVNKSEHVDLDKLQQTVVKSTDRMASPFDIIPQDMNVWEAWNLQTGIKQIVNNKIPSFKDSFQAQRKALKISGGFPGKVVLSPLTLISGVRQYSDWVEGQISRDSQIIMSYREDSLVRNERNDLSLKLTIRNDGKKTATEVVAVVEALDKTGKVVGKEEKMVPDLEPLAETPMMFEITQIPTAIKYRVRFLFPHEPI